MSKMTDLHCVFERSGGIFICVIIRTTCNYEMHSLGNQIRLETRFGVR